MSKVIDLAKKAGASIESWMVNPPKPAAVYMTPEQLERFYTLARADLLAENAKLREALERARLGFAVMVTADDIDWVTHQAQRQRDAARAALGES